MRITLLLAATVACSSAPTPGQSHHPIGVITAPAGTTEAIEGYTVTLQGTVSDHDHAPATLSVAWLSGDEVLCEAVQPSEAGLSTCTTELWAGDELIEMRVTAPDGQQTSAWQDVVLRDNAPPDIEVTLSEERVGLLLLGSVGDDHEHPESLKVSLHIDGVEIPINVGPNGHFQRRMEDGLSRVSVVDPAGLSAELSLVPLPATKGPALRLVLP